MINNEVQKLYPDAQLPSFEIEKNGPEESIMIYRSTQRMGDLASGLKEACIDHFHEKKEKITTEYLEPHGEVIRFTIHKFA